MRNNIKAFRLTGIVFLCLLTTAAGSLRAQEKLRVLKNDSPVRLSPDMDSEVIALLPAGAIVDSIGKEQQYYKIVLTRKDTGLTLSGYIHENRVEVEKQLTNQAVNASQTERAVAPAGKSMLGYGLGVGIPYGGIAGINAELFPYIPGADKLGDYLGINFGLGYCYPGVGLDVGLRGYPLGRDKTIFPRLGFHLGSVGWYLGWSEDSELYGGTICIGPVFRFGKKSSLAFDLHYTLFLFGWDLASMDMSRFKISLGYQHSL